MTQERAGPQRYLIAGWRIERFGTLDSTSEEVKRRALAGDEGRIWIVADQQTAGRGRQGRDWRSDIGNFHGTALMREPCSLEHAPRLGFVAGVAARAAAQDLGAHGVKLKWPNDLVVGRAKVAGVLLEAWNIGRGRFAVGVGIGVNLGSHPANLPYPTTDLGKLVGRKIAVRDYLERLAVRFGEGLALFARGTGFEQVRARWLEAAAGLGEPMRATTAKGVREGLFEGLDDQGRLLLRTSNAIETLESADIALLGPSGGI